MCAVFVSIPANLPVFVAAFYRCRMDCDALISLLHEGYFALYLAGEYVADSPYALLPPHRPSLASFQPLLDRPLVLRSAARDAGVPPLPASAAWTRLSSSDVFIDGVRYAPVGSSVPAAGFGVDHATALPSLRGRVRDVLNALHGGPDYAERLHAAILLSSQSCYLWGGEPSVYLTPTTALIQGGLYAVPGPLPVLPPHDRAGADTPVVAPPYSGAGFRTGVRGRVAAARASRDRMRRAGFRVGLRCAILGCAGACCHRFEDPVVERPVAAAPAWYSRSLRVRVPSGFLSAALGVPPAGVVPGLIPGGSSGVAAAGIVNTSSARFPSCEYDVWCLVVVHILLSYF